MDANEDALEEIHWVIYRRLEIPPQNIQTAEESDGRTIVPRGNAATSRQ
jgi:hypothetical protein